MSAIVDTLNTALQAAPDNWQFRLALIEALVSEERVDEAYSVLSQVTELPADIESCLMAAKAYAVFEPESGMGILDQIIASEPTCAAAYLEKARIFYNGGDIESAQKQFAAATAFDPNLSDPELAQALGTAQAQPGVATPPPMVTEQPVPTPAPVSQVADVQPPQPHPAPTELPAVAMPDDVAVTTIKPLVHPDEIPNHPSLAYVADPTYVETVYTPDEAYLQELHNVTVHSAHYEDPVTYDYQQPDDSIFEPTTTADDIQHGFFDEEGATLQETIRRNKALKEEEIAKRNLIATIQSVAVALISLLAICILLVMVVTAMPRPNPPQVVASSAVSNDEDSLEETVIKQTTVTPTPTQSASAMSMEVMTVASASDMSMMSFDSPTMDLGSASLGSDFGSSMSFGDAAGGGSVSFFGGKATGKRFLFILDDSKSMKPHQVKLRNEELEKTFKTLKGVQYQVVLFAGGAYFADKGWGYKANPGGKGAPREYTSPGGNYKFDKDGLDGRIKAPKWKEATSSNKKETIDFVKKAKLFYGTDWGKAFELGFEMKPSPDVIFFMSDGSGNTSEPAIAKANRSNGKAKINTLAMQTGSGAKAFQRIAKDSGGDFNIVDKRGKLIDGDDYIRDPADFAGKLK